MRRWLLSVFLCCVSGMAFSQGAQYSATVTPYTSTPVVFTPPCAVGQSCVNYSTSMVQTGTFTVAPPLAPNLASQEIHGSIVSYSFFDGINTYSSSDADSRIFSFRVTTNGAGEIVSAGVILQKWLSGTNGAHISGDRLSSIIFGGLTRNNESCTSVGASSFTGVPDSCVTRVVDAGTSSGMHNASTTTWQGPVLVNLTVAVPTLSEWAMIVMASLMAMFAISRMRRQR